MLYTCYFSPAYYMENSSGTNRVNFLFVRVKRLARAWYTGPLSKGRHVGLFRVGVMIDGYFIFIILN